MTERKRGRRPAGGLRGLWRSRRGAIGVATAASLPLVLALAALVVDYGYVTTVRNELQVTADAAALAAVRELPGATETRDRAKEYAAKNMPAGANGEVLVDGDVELGSWLAPLRTFTAGGVPLNAVRVAARRAQSNANPVPALFAKAIGFASFDVNGTAVAARTGGDALSCIHPLNRTRARSLLIQVTGAPLIDAVGCNVQVDSCAAANAIWVQGAPPVTVSGDADSAGYISACGGIDALGWGAGGPTRYADTGYQEDDPFESWDPGLRDLPCDHVDFSFTDTAELDPGVYCGGITGSGTGTVTFRNDGNGVYVIKNGPLSLAAGLAIQGQGVGFYMSGGGAGISITGTAQMTLSAATTGPLAGFVFAGDRENPSATSHFIRGAAEGGYKGIVYLPGAGVAVQKNADSGGASSDCAILIADTISFLGKDTLWRADNTCADYAGLDVFTQTLSYRLAD